MGLELHARVGGLSETAAIRGFWLLYLNLGQRTTRRDETLVDATSLKWDIVVGASQDFREMVSHPDTTALFLTTRDEQ